MRPDYTDAEFEVIKPETPPKTEPHPIFSNGLFWIVVLFSLLAIVRAGNSYFAERDPTRFERQSTHSEAQGTVEPQPVHNAAQQSE